MKPRVLLDEVKTPEGGHMTLIEHDGRYQIALDGRELMNSFVSASESEMGERVAGRPRSSPEPVYLIGGLGMGFTLRAVLEALPAEGRVLVAELLPCIVEWNRGHLRELNGALLEDPRVSMYTGDVAQLLNESEAGSYDGILLDVDNGPAAMVQKENKGLYSLHGLARIQRLLRPDGEVAFWSASGDRPFEARLKRVGFSVEAVPTRAYAGAKRFQYMIFYATIPEPAANLPS